MLYGVNVCRIHGGIVSSVVPSMVGVLEVRCACSGIRDVIEVSSGVKTGLNIRSEQPRQVGSVPRSRCGGRPCQGKAAVRGDYARHRDHVHRARPVRCAGRLSHHGGRAAESAALREQAAQLRRSPSTPRTRAFSPGNTVDAMRVGAVYGAASLVDGMVERFAEALGETPYVVLTGELAPLVLPICVSRSSTMKALCSTVCT